MILAYLPRELAGCRVAATGGDTGLRYNQCLLAACCASLSTAYFNAVTVVYLLIFSALGTDLLSNSSLLSNSFSSILDFLWQLRQSSNEVYQLSNMKYKCSNENKTFRIV